MEQPAPKPDLSRLTIKRDDSARVHALPRGVYLGIGGALLAIVLLTFVWPSKDQSSPSRASENSSPRTPVPVSNSATLLNATGYVVAQRQAAVSSKATGRLRELRVVEGDTVKEGQVIGILEHDDLEAEVKRQEAQIAVQSARVKAAEADAYEAGLQRKRMETLFQERAMAKSNRDEAIARAVSTNSEVEAAKANVALAQAELEKAKVELSYTYILAPFDGTVLTKNADIGEIVAPFGSSTNARAAVVTIADMDSLQVEADVSEANIGKLFVGQECEIMLDSVPNKSYRGLLNRIVPTVDRAKATVMTKIRFLEKDERVLPEMSAKVAFRLRHN